MPSIKAVKNRISSVNETRKITNAMYVISSIKMRKVKEELDNAMPYFMSLRHEVRRAFKFIDDTNNPYIKTHKEGVTGYLIITADKGLCGPYNKNVIELARKKIRAEEDKVFVVGEYGRRYLSSHNGKIEKAFNYTAQNPTFYRAKVIADELLKLYLNKTLAKVYIIYTDLTSSMTMEPKIARLLPINKDDLPSAVENTHFIIEPSIDKVIDSIVPSYVAGFIYGALVDSFCSEQSARMLAMDYANKNADKLLDDLRLQYNNLRQGAITQEILEVSAGVKGYNENK